MAIGSGDMTTGEEAVYALPDLLNAGEIPYMLVGPFSSNAWGESRSTKDADFVVEMPPQKRTALYAALPAQFLTDDQISFETITGLTRQIRKVSPGRRTTIVDFCPATICPGA
ncbi:MAG: hypothetical protein KDN19_13620 [Verrucomicrobiae bacterium]|nr:hypothetical protein [Verrucomicrobiae bacterium]